MGITTGTWLRPSYFRAKGDLAAPAGVAQRLREATGLRIELRGDGGVSLPSLREKLFDWDIRENSITVYGYMPAHPYLWENLDAIMTGAGYDRGRGVYVWRPNPAHARLRAPWNSLPPRDRFILTLPSFAGVRIFDVLLRSSERAPP